MRDETKRVTWFDQKIMEGKRDILLGLIEKILKVKKDSSKEVIEDLVRNDVDNYRRLRFEFGRYSWAC